MAEREKIAITTEDTENTERNQSCPSVSSVVNDFQETELGPLPAHWKVVRLGEVLREVDRRSRVVSICPDRLYATLVTRLYAQGVAAKSTIPGRKISAKQMYRVQKGDFIFSKINIRKGAFGVIDSRLEGAVVSTEHPIFRPSDNLDLEYLRFYLSLPHTWERFRQEAKGFSGKERVKPREFLQVAIPLPPLEEQRAIAQILRAVQRARDATQQVIHAAQALKTSLMQRLFTFGIPTTAGTARDQSRPAAPSVVSELQETELGALPAHWKVVRLGEVVVFERGISWSKREESKSGVGIVGIPNIRDGKVDLSPRAFISKRVSPDKMLHEGDILLVGSSGSIDNVGRVGVVEEAPTVPTTYASFTVRARAIADAVDQQFLAYLLSSERVPFSQFAKRAADGKYNLQVQQLRDYALALPPLEEQRAIASILKAVDAKIAAERARRDALETLFKTLLHELMTGKRRVNTVSDL